MSLYGKNDFSHVKPIKTATMSLVNCIRDQEYDRAYVLIKNGADVNESKDGETPLSAAEYNWINYGCGGAYMMKFLIEMGADASQLEIDEEEFAVDCNTFKSLDQITESFVSDPRGLMPILYDYFKTHDVNEKGYKDRTAMHTMARTCDMVKFLVDMGVDVNAKDKHNMTPMYYMWDNSDDDLPLEEIVEKLLDNGADPSQVLEDKYFMERSSPELIEIFRKKGFL